MEDTKLTCGCELVWRDGKGHLHPCCEQHRTTALMRRMPGSSLIIHRVGEQPS